MTLRQSILATLTYSDYFHYPLTLAELHERLIEVSTTRASLLKQIQILVRQKKLGQTKSFYHLAGRSKVVAKRNSAYAHSLPEHAKAASLALRLGRIPGVLAIYLTGSLAMLNSSDSSDIDFMIIAKNHKLWTTRLLLTLYLTLLGLRRTRDSTHHSGKACLNLYLTPTTYSLPPTKRSLYTAYELIQAVPLYDPHDTHSALLSANSWLAHYLPNFPLPKTTFSPPIFDIRYSIFESMAYHLQLWYMRPKLTREYVTSDVAFFHPHNPGAKVLAKLSQKV